MSDGRSSFRKTVLAAALGAALSLVLLVGAGWLAAGASTPWGRLSWSVLALGFGLLAAWLVVVITGGLIAIRRADAEIHGQPYRASGRPENRGALRRALWRLAHPRALGPGDAVVVREAADILATLDAAGTLDGLPFMPEMLDWCGRPARVLRRVEKVHDWVGKSGLYRMRDTVLLEDARCAGAAHDGCQARCHILWKEAWLRPARGTAVRLPAAGRAAVTADDLVRLTRNATADGVQFVCQATRVIAAAAPMARNDPRHYLRDLTGGNLRLSLWATGIALACFNAVQNRRGGARSPSWGSAPDSAAPAPEPLGLQAGDWVRVRAKADIERTLDRNSRNRGLWFDGDMLRFCGSTHRVLARVDHLIDERTGRMVRPATPCIVLEDVTATGEYLGFCPQNEYLFWREAWLERAEPPAG